MSRLIEEMVYLAIPQTPEIPNRDGLPLPNELISELIEHLPTADVLNLGQTCRQLASAVNYDAEFRSKKIIARERARLLKAMRHPCDPLVPSLEGLSLLEALRLYMLYHEPVKRSDALCAMAVFTRHYQTHNRTADSCPEYLMTMGRAGIRQLAEYLVVLSDVVARSEGSVKIGDVDRSNGNGEECKTTKSTCDCEMCQRMNRSCDYQSWIGTAIWRFERSGWWAAHPLGFLNDVVAGDENSMGSVISEEDWLAMVRSVMKNPIRQFSNMDRDLGAATLNSVVLPDSMALPNNISKEQMDALVNDPAWERKQELALQELLTMTGLPHLEGYEQWSYMPRLSASEWKEIEAGKDMVQVLAQTKAVRAARELYRRMKDEGKPLVDPESLWLRARIFEEVEILRCITTIG